MFDDYLRFQAGFRGGDVALVTRRGGTSFAALEAAVRRAVAELRELEVPAGESVALAVRDPWLVWVLMLALARLGIASAPGHDSESRVLLTLDPDGDGASVVRLSADQVAAIEGGPERPFFRILPDPDALGRVVRTSGTTGAVRRVGYSWRTLDGNLNQQLATHADIPGTWMIAAGLSTPFEIHHVLAAWAAGRTAATGFGPDWAVIARTKPRLLGILPVQIQHILTQVPPDMPRWPLRIVSGGSRLPERLLATTRERLTDDLVVNYGMSEVSQIATADLAILEREPKAAGYPRPGIGVRVVDEEGAELPAGEPGRLLYRTTRPSTGYIGDAELTAEHYRDGWYWSRDLGALREDGMLLLEGRIDDVMNLGGHKILPSWIEEGALSYAKVREAAAFPVTADTGLQWCSLALVAEDGFDIARLQEALAGRLLRSQSYHVFLVESLPRNAMGKVDRDELTALAKGSRGWTIEPLAGRSPV